MIKFTPSILDDIRSRLTISSVVGRRVQWDRRKSNPGKGDFWACCPFHAEKSPSFHVEDRKGRYHCFGCKASGDVFTFLVEKEGLSFPEAVEQLAGEASIVLPKFTAAETEKEKVKDSLYDVMELASIYFQSKLWASEGSNALSYLRSRGLKDETIKEFGLGFASSSKVGLKNFILSKEISETQMVEAGLLLSGEDFPTSIDRFRERIIFPIQDAKGKTIAFGGRAMSKDAPAKYLNSPETPLFSKGKVLYNFSRARQEAFDKGSIVIVEGYMDAIAVYQSGNKNVVATLGTAMTEDHLAIVWRLVPQPVLCFDGDNAGRNAASKAFDRALPFVKAGHSLGFAFLQDSKDPADMMLDGKNSEFLALVNNPMPMSEYFWNRSTQGLPIVTPEQKAGLEIAMLQSIEQIKDESVRRQYRYQMRIRLSDLFYQFDKTSLRKLTNQRGRKTLLPSLNDEHASNVEKIVLGLAVEFPHFFYGKEHQVIDMTFKDENFRVFQRELYSLLVSEENRSVSAIYSKLDDKYYKVLEQVHGHEIVSKSSNHKLLKRRGHALYNRFPLSKYELDESFVHRMLDYFYLVLQRDAVREDLGEAGETLVQELNLKNEERLNALLKELEHLNNAILEQEKVLTEEASVWTEQNRTRKAAEVNFVQI